MITNCETSLGELNCNVVNDVVPASHQTTEYLLNEIKQAILWCGDGSAGSERGARRSASPRRARARCRCRCVITSD